MGSHNYDNILTACMPVHACTLIRPHVYSYSCIANMYMHVRTVYTAQ